MNKTTDGNTVQLAEFLLKKVIRHIALLTKVFHCNRFVNIQPDIFFYAVERDNCWSVSSIPVGAA
ncbi:hypothetical protein [Chitinophaga agri]|uniref:Uncharacterized protein n=1 Tax=Chitinophaga agri TaxID=2703787 RepID=A0A6B9ZM60_9BACT|nr:hypothetical protein [Chitinophaga agri]QHS63076.1 hypothetical protein GWR21_26855 [Chitinophaga agri]